MQTRYFFLISSHTILQLPPLCGYEYAHYLEIIFYVVSPVPIPVPKFSGFSEMMDSSLSLVR
jgi:hypothetical protein